MNIAICDDCRNDIGNLRKLIEQIVHDPEEWTIYEFNSGEDFIKNYREFDLVFLDINMQGSMKGTQVAEYIRERSKDTVISFYTGIDYPASQVVHVQPFSYLIKDSLFQEGASRLSDTLQEVRRRKDSYKLKVSCGAHTLSLQLSDILYIAIHKKQSEIYLTESRTREIVKFLDIPEKEAKNFTVKSKQKVDDYYKQLKDHGFAYAKVSYIINLRHVVGCFKEYVQLTGGVQLTVARAKRTQFEKELSSYWGRN